MANPARVKLQVLRESITLGGRLVLPAGSYDGSILYADAGSDRPTGEILMVALEVDADVAERAGATFFASTASISINVTG